MDYPYACKLDCCIEKLGHKVFPIEVNSILTRDACPELEILYLEIFSCVPQ